MTIRRRPTAVVAPLAVVPPVASPVPVPASQGPSVWGASRRSCVATREGASSAFPSGSAIGPDRSIDRGERSVGAASGKPPDKRGPGRPQSTTRGGYS